MRLADAQHEDKRDTDSALACTRNIELLTDANIELKHVTDFDISKTRKFLHTPKDGQYAQDNEEFYVQNYSNNKFIQDFMERVDNTSKEWLAE